MPEFAIRDGDISARLAALSAKPLNFDPTTLDQPVWERDDYRQPLPPESAGPPEPGGSWETAVELSRSYAFADPSLVEAHYDPRVPLQERELLLVLHALGARIYAGVRVGTAGTESRSVHGHEARVSFWNYRTLEGHVEAGQRDFEVWKWLDTGQVEFRTHALSRPADTDPLIRLGFRLLGRHKQVEFGRRACSRMLLLTQASLRNRDAPRNPRVLDGRLLAIYVRDHHALLVALRELAKRMSRGSRPASQERYATELRKLAESDLASIQQFLHDLDSDRSKTREHAVWAAEKLGRLKLNGRLLRASPLSPVTELEGSRLLLEATRALWVGLAHLALGPEDADERAQRIEQLLDTAEQLRLEALDHAASRRIA